MTAKEKILVIKLGALGDFIQALGAMQAIRRHHPNAFITLLTTEPFRAFGESCGYFDRVWSGGRPRPSQMRGWLELVTNLRTEHFARVYDLQNNDRTALYLRLMSGKKKPEWVGAARGASHRNAAPERTEGLAFEGHKQTLALAGIHDVRPDDLSWIKADTDRFAIKKPYALFMPGSAPQHPQKRWPAEEYGALAALLASRGLQPVVCGTQGEAGLAAIIKERCPGSLDLCGRTNLADLTVLARTARLAVGNDTGTMHLVAATGCPALVLFSRYSNPARHAPMGKNVVICQQSDLGTLKAGHLLPQIEAMLPLQANKYHTGSVI